jgi:AcrR family transcriptional regulator
MTDTDFDSALITAALAIAAEQGWRRVTVTEAARAAGLPLERARVRFPSRSAILPRLGALADQAALADAPKQGPVRDRLFDLLMHRIDAFQLRRAGVIAVLRALPFDPPAALMLACATGRSMRWMLEAAGIPVTGPRGALTIKGCVAVWLWTLRAWERDGSDDLSATMAALDSALQRAEQVADWLGGTRKASPAPESPAESGVSAETGATPGIEHQDGQDETPLDG